MGSATISMSRVFVIVGVGVLVLSAVTQCSSVHSQRAGNPSLQDTLLNTKRLHGFHQDSSEDFHHKLRRNVVRRLDQSVSREGQSMRASALFKHSASARFQGFLPREMNFERWAKKSGSSHDGQVGSTETPVAKAWPEEFTVNFTTKSGAATGFLAYDWGQKRQIIYHGPKSTYCQALGTDDACQMFEFPGGTYSYIPSVELCFLAVEGVGSLPPTWTMYSDYTGTVEFPGIGLCKGYAFPPTEHVWYETVEGSLPCVFVFPDPSMTYYFLPDTFKVGTPDEKYFDLPDYCFEGAKMVE